jgi:peroxiredoxin family protein
VIRNKCPGLPESDVQLLGTELLAAEVLRIGHSTREEFAGWLAAFSSDELRSLLNDRKSIRENARKELEQYKIQKIEEQKRMEEYRQLYEEQLKTAREERTLVFNPRTQKMEVFDNPSKKKKQGFFPWQK